MAGRLSARLSCTLGAALPSAAPRLPEAPCTSSADGSSRPCSAWRLRAARSLLRALGLCRGTANLSLTLRKTLGFLEYNGERLQGRAACPCNQTSAIFTAEECDALSLWEEALRFVYIGDCD